MIEIKILTKNISQIDIISYFNENNILILKQVFTYTL
jgi:hypothetical protein